MGTLSKNAQVLKAICTERPELDTTKLQKLAYLVDLEARKFLGRPVSEFQYIWWHHGPFDSRIYNAMAELEKAGLVKRYVEHGWGCVRHSERNCAVEYESDLAPVEIEIIKHTMKRYGHLSREQLLKLAYSSEPMDAVDDKGQALPMYVVDNMARDEFGFDLEELVRRERQMESGDYVSESDFFDAIQAQLRTGSH